MDSREPAQGDERCAGDPNEDEMSGYIANRLEVGKDGKTAYERSRGKRAKVMGI